MRPEGRLTILAVFTSYVCRSSHAWSENRLNQLYHTAHKGKFRIEKRGEAMGTFNGVGTTFYGKASKRSDGSYVATDWFVVLSFPIFPIRSMRLRPTSSKGFSVIVFSHRTVSYQILETIPLRKNLKQIMLTWLWLFIPLAAVFYFTVMHKYLYPYGTCMSWLCGNWKWFPR